MGPMLRTVVMFGCSTAGLAEGVAAPRPFLRTLQQLTNVPSSADPRVCPPLLERRLGIDGDTPTDSHQDPDRRGLRALVLRPGAVPVDRLRRPDPAERRGLPLRGPVRRGDPARAGVRRADLRRLGRQGEADRARRRGRRGGDDRAAGALRADPHRHPGDPAPEDAARRDLRRAHARARNEAEPLPEGGDLPRGAGRAVGAARRDLPHLRHPHPGRVQPMDAGRRRGSARPRRGPLDRARLARLVRRRGRQGAADPRQPGAGGHRPGLRRRRGLRRALRAPGPALRPDPQHRRRCSRPRRSETRT